MAKIWKTLIIDDEEPARQRLKRLLSVYEEIQIAGEADNGASGLQEIAAHNPDLIFLDIEMPVLNGFEMLGRLNKPPKVIFTTAYDQYAIKAFDEESVDYLLKPVEQERLEKAINKLKNYIANAETALPLELLMKHFAVKKEIKTLTVKIGDKILLVKLNDLVHADAEDKYVFLNTISGKRYLTDFTLASLEEKLPEQFVRISRSSILNTDFISEIKKGFNGGLFFIMTDPQGTKLSSGRSYNSVLRERFEI